MKFKYIKKVTVHDTSGLYKEVISKIENPMFYLGIWIQEGSTFADLRNSKNEPIRIFHERLKDY